MGLESPIPRAVSLRKSHPGQAAHPETGSLAPELQGLLWGGGTRGSKTPLWVRRQLYMLWGVNTVPPCNDSLASVETETKLGPTSGPQVPTPSEYAGKSPTHHRSLGLAVSTAHSEGCAQAGGCSLCPSVGGRASQIAACGVAAQTGRSLLEGVSGYVVTTCCSHHLDLCWEQGQPCTRMAHRCPLAPPMAVAPPKAPWSRLCFLGSWAKRGLR